MPPSQTSWQTVGVYSVAAVLAGLTLASLWRQRRRDEDSKSSSDEDFPLSEHMKAIEIKPGLVLLKGALDMTAQLDLCRAMFEVGHGDRKWWTLNDSPHGLALTTPRGAGAPAPAPEHVRWQLTGERQGRGRYYDAVENFGPRAGAVARLAERCARLARGLPRHGASMPTFEATHLLLLFYATGRRLGWHRDNGAQDGASLQPVVSISLGHACDFVLKVEARGLG